MDTIILAVAAILISWAIGQDAPPTGNLPVDTAVNIAEAAGAGDLLASLFNPRVRSCREAVVNGTTPLHVAAKNGTA